VQLVNGQVHELRRPNLSERSNMAVVSTKNRARQNVARLLSLLERNPKAYRHEVRRLHTEEPETFERYVRSVQRGVRNEGGPKWPRAAVRAFILGRVS
jgi:hypothetical protein